VSANDLLLWMSARGEGSREQYRAAVEELHAAEGEGEEESEGEAASRRDLPLYTDLRLTLQRLGHAEFFAGAASREWRVTPPALAATASGKEWLGIVAGARSVKLLGRIHESAAPARLEVLRRPRCPDHLLVWAQSAEELAGVAERAGLAFQINASSALLSCIPAIDDPAVRRPHKLPFGAGWKVERLSEDGYAWRDSSVTEARTSSGLFRFALRHEKLILYCSQGSAAVVPPQVGKYIVLRRGRRKVLRYDVAGEKLTVPANFRPPFLVERALILCSGVLPTYRKDSGRGVLEYSGIPHATARAAAALLRQELT
jgi:hypothetical protein